MKIDVYVYIYFLLLFPLLSLLLKCRIAGDFQRNVLKNWPVKHETSEYYIKYSASVCSYVHGFQLNLNYSSLNFFSDNVPKQRSRIRTIYDISYNVGFFLYFSVS